MDNWDDIRIFLAVARGGSGAAGARQLGMDQSTISRRINAFEDRLGTRLFDRVTTGYGLNTAGRRMFETALRIEREVADLDHALVGQDQNLSGTVRIATVDTLSNHLLFPATSSFLHRYPNINLQITTSVNSAYDVVVQKDTEADITFRTSNNPPEDLVGRRLATAAFAIYASRRYLASLDDRKEQMVWLNWDDGSQSPAWPSMAPEIPDNLCRLRIDSVPSLLSAVRQDIGATVLPCFMGDADSDLVRIPPGKVVSQRDVWLLTHKNLRYSARIRAFLDHIAETMKPMTDLIEGRVPQK